jgi:hypothetical protein
LTRIATSSLFSRSHTEYFLKNPREVFLNMYRITRLDNFKATQKHKSEMKSNENERDQKTTQNSLAQNRGRSRLHYAQSLSACMSYILNFEKEVSVKATCDVLRLVTQKNEDSKLSNEFESALSLNAIQYLISEQMFDFIVSLLNAFCIQTTEIQKKESRQRQRITGKIDEWNGIYSFSETTRMGIKEGNQENSDQKSVLPLHRNAIPIPFLYFMECFYSLGVTPPPTDVTLLSALSRDLWCEIEYDLIEKLLKGEKIIKDGDDVTLCDTMQVEITLCLLLKQKLSILKKLSDLVLKYDCYRHATPTALSFQFLQYLSCLCLKWLEVSHHQSCLLLSLQKDNSNDESSFSQIRSILIGTWKCVGSSAVDCLSSLLEVVMFSIVFMIGILYFVFCILYFVFCILYFVFCILYFVFCILYFALYTWY